MDITSLGLSSFRLRGKAATVVTDPYNSTAVGLKFPKNIEADVVTISHTHPDHNEVGAVGGNPFIITGPGEYEIKGVSIIGVTSYHDDKDGSLRGPNTIYRIEMDGLVVAHLGDLGHVLSSAQVEQLDGIDILIIPVGGVYSLDAVHASQVISDIEPRVVIPMHYGRPELNPKVFGELAPVAAFLKQVGKESVVPVPKLTMTKDKLPLQLEVVILE